MIQVTKPIQQMIVDDSETTQDIQKLCNEIEASEKVFDELIKDNKEQFDF